MREVMEAEGVLPANQTGDDGVGGGDNGEGSSHDDERAEERRILQVITLPRYSSPAFHLLLCH